MSHTGIGPSPGASAGQCSLHPSLAVVGWDLKNSQYTGACSSAPRCSPCTLPVCTKAAVINTHVWWRWLEKKIKRMKRWGGEGDKNKRNVEGHLFCICHARKCKTGGSVKLQERCFPQLLRQIHPVFSFSWAIHNYFFPLNESSNSEESFIVGKSALAPRTKTSFDLTSPLRIEQILTEPEKY